MLKLKANQHPFYLFVKEIHQYIKVVYTFWISDWIHL